MFQVGRDTRDMLVASDFKPEDSCGRREEELYSKGLLDIIDHNFGRNLSRGLAPRRRYDSLLNYVRNGLRVLI